MSRLLHIQVSPRAGRSHSRAVAEEFIEAYRQHHPEDEVVTLDLFSMELPAFDGAVIQAKYNIMQGRSHSDAETGAWQAVEAEIERFVGADKYLVSNPMWNFGISYRLKHYIDVITQPGYTFAVTPEGEYKGLVPGKPVLLIHARGGDYPEDSPAAAFDFQVPYLKALFGFIGFTNIHSVTVEPTLAGDPNKARAAAAEKVRALAASF